MSERVYAELRSVGFDSTYESWLRVLEWYCDRLRGDPPRCRRKLFFPPCHCSLSEDEVSLQICMKNNSAINSGLLMKTPRQRVVYG